MKFKKSSLKSLVLIAFVIGILLITGGIAITPDEKAKVDKVEKDGNKVKTNNSFFELQWDYDVTGYGADGLFYLKSSNFKTLDKNRSVYVGLLFPSLISNNNKIFIEQKESIKEVTQKSFFCNTAKYGWQVFNQQIWCNTTQTKFNNVTLLSESYDIKTLYDVTSDNYLISTTNNLTVYYNVTTFTNQLVKKDLSLSLINTEDKDIKTYVKKLNKDFSDLGNNWLLVNQPINLTLGESNKIEFKIDVNRSLLPLKYSVVIIDADDNSYIIIDPTIVNARTWSNNDDFTNGTVVTNLTTSATGITLTPSSTGVNTFIVADDFADGTINASIWVNTNCAEASGVISCGSDQWVRSVDLSASPFNFNSSQNYNLSIKGKNPSANRDCFTLQDDLPAVSADGTCNDPNSVNNDRQGFYLIGSNDNVLLPYKTSFSQDVFSDTTTTFSFNFIHNASGYIILKDGSLVNSTGNNTINNMIYWHIGDSQSGQQGGTIEMDDFYLQSLGTDVAAKTHGEYSDRQGWTPQTGNQISNISITATNSSGGNIRFRYNSTNASVDTSDWTILSNGTQTIQLNLGANNNIFYQYDFNGTGTGKVVSYTINEGQAQAVTSSCTYVSGNWTIQGSEKCGLNTTAMGGNNIIFNGTGQIRILQNITNCGVVTLQNGVDVTVTSGARLC